MGWPGELVWVRVRVPVKQTLCVSGGEGGGVIAYV